MHHIYQELKDTNKDYYIYDLNALKKRVAYITEKLNHNVYYAVKANSHHRILSTLLPYVAGFEVASVGEIMKVRQISSDAHIIFGGPVKTYDDLAYAIDHHVSSIQIESLFELDHLIALTEQKESSIDVLIRINLKDLHTSAKLKMAGATQFGMPDEDIKEAMNLIKSSPWINFKGLHFHAMSNNLDANAHIAFIQQALQYHHPDIEAKVETINVGGGIGIDYQHKEAFDFEHFANSIHPMPKLTFEIGRYLVGPIGYYAANVFDIKKNKESNYVMLNGGTHHFRFPKAWNHQHYHTLYCPRIEQGKGRTKTLSNEEAFFAGKLCTPNDVFGTKYPIENIQTGDWVIFHFAGAYAYDISHINFLSHPEPEIIFVAT